MLSRHFGVVVFLFLPLVFFLTGNNLLHAQQTDKKTEIVIEDPRIGIIQGIAIDDKGRIYVGDLSNLKVHRYLGNGKHERSFGRKGRGPGEFRAISGVRIGSADSLYVYDSRSRRLTIFPEDTDAEQRTISLPAGPGKFSPGLIGTLISGLQGLWLTTDGKPLVSYSKPINPMEELKETPPLRIRYAGAPSNAEPALEIRGRQMLALQGDRGAMLTVMPFGKQPVVETFGGDKLYFGYSDSLVIRKKKIDESRSEIVVSHEFSRVDLSEGLLRSKLEREDDQKLLDAFDRVEEKTPSRVPAFEDFAIDKRGRFWVAVNTKRSLNKGQTEYWVFGPDGDIIRKVVFDRLVFLKAFSEKKAYGIATKPNGLQRIVQCSISSLLP